MVLKKNYSHSDKIITKTFLDNSPDILIALDHTGTIRYVSSSVKTILGFSPEKYIGKKTLSFVHKQDIPALKEALISAHKSPKKFVIMEYRVRNKKKEWRNFQLTARQIKNENGKILIFCVARDITDQKKAHEMREQAEQRFSTIFEHVALGLALFTFNGKLKFLEFNPAMEKMLGYSSKELLKMDVKDLSPKEDHNLDIKMFKELLKSQRDSYQIEKRYIRKDGSMFWGRLTVSTVRVDERTPRFLVSSVEDISESKKLEEQKRNFLSAIAHDLKTPLTTSQIVVQMLSKECKKYNPSPELMKQLKLLDNELHRLNRLVGDILDISRIETGKVYLRLEIVELCSFIESVVEGLKPLYPSSLIEYDMCNNYYVKIDKDRITQVMSNLINNAIKYSPADKPVTISVRRTKNNVTVYIKDRGVGIPKDKQKQIFTQFYQVNEQFSTGLGLGLYICKEIIRRHNGTIRLRSSEGKGSTFYFTLPVIVNKKL